MKKEFLVFWNSAISDLENYDVVLIDEIGPGVNWEIISEAAVLELIEKKPRNTELILTGRDFPQSLKNAADYVSEIRKLKHPFDVGVFAREGVEY